MAQQHQVRDYMTLGSHSIGLEQSLLVASRHMREQQLQHLPVLHGGVLRGVLSERDIALVNALDLDLADVTVEEAMSAEPLTVTPKTPLARAARAMAAHECACAVVMDDLEVQGILTSADALNALATVLEALGPEQQTMMPSQVRSVILSEHVNIRRLLDRSEAHVQRILAGGGYGESEVLSLRGIARQLYTGMCRHMELENRVLTPALASLPAFGEASAERLLAEHAEQKSTLEHTLGLFDDPRAPPAALAAALGRLVATLRRDMDHEEETLLHPRLLHDASSADAG